MSNKHIALEIAKTYRIFPLLPHGKTPAVADWAAKSTQDFNQIDHWWTTNPSYNIGIPTGAVNAISVIDIDDISACPHPDIVDSGRTVVTTPRGYHIYCTYTGERNKIKVLPGVDVRGDGGYVVGPGSCIGEKEYALRSGEIKPIPLWLEKALNKPVEAHLGEDVGVGVGQRHEALLKAAGALRRVGMLTLGALQAVNDEFSPPLNDDAVVEMYGRAMGYSVDDPLSPIPSLPPLLTAHDLEAQVFSSLEDKVKISGMPTGVGGLDKLLGGGLRKGELFGLNAVAKTGKSSFIHQIIANLIDRNIPVGYASREMRPADEVVPNLLSILFNENAWREEMTPERKQRYRTAMASWSLYFSRGYGTFEMPALRAWLEQLAAAGVEVVFIDHLHYLLKDPEDYAAAVSLAQGLKQAVNELDISIMCIIQPTKLYEGMTLGLQTIRGGAGVGQALDGLMTLERFRDRDGELSKNVSVLRVTDARNKLVTTGMLYLQYDAVSTRVYEVSKDAVVDIREDKDEDDGE